MKEKDCMTAVYTYDELAKAYQDFCAPAAAVYINNEKTNMITGKGIAIDSVQVMLSTENTASLSFQILNAFDLENRQIKDEVKAVCSVGTVIEAALGYGSNLTTVFKGYVSEYRISYQNDPVISVTAVDLRKLLMQNRRKKFTYVDICSNIFRTIIGAYSNLYGELHVDDTNGEMELIQNGSDYDFIMEELCSKGKREFFVVGKHVYFREKKEAKNAFLELEWGKNLISFQNGASYCNIELKAYSPCVPCGTEDENKRKEASVTVKTREDTPSLRTGGLIEEWEPGYNMSREELEDMLRQQAAGKEKQQITASGSTIGLPEIVPGRYIAIKGVGLSEVENYYIGEVTHSFGSDGFTTSFTVGEDKGNIVRKGEIREKEKEEKQCKSVMSAVVLQNWSDKEPGKVLVEMQTGEEGKNSTKWLPVMQPYCGEQYGFYFLPEIGANVVIGSQMGDVNSLVVLGTMTKQPPADTADEENKVKRIRTKAGHEIVFFDEKDAGQIQIQTKENLHVVLKDKEKTISITDGEEKNGLLIDAANGRIRLVAEKEITLSANGSDMLSLKADRNTLKLEAEKLEAKGKQSVGIQGNNLSIKGTQTEIKADGTMKLESSGIAELKGATVKIN